MLPGINIPSVNNINPIDLSLEKIRLIQDHSLNILPGLLHYGDSISMAHGIESRNPFLDYRLVEWSFKLPSYLLFKNGQTKWIIREYLKRNGQHKIATRMDKKGYPTAIKKWTTNKENYDIENYMTSSTNPVLQWCDKAKIKQLFVKSRNNIPAADFHIYKLLSTQMWMNECLK
jgi:asparagine synthase (glutamine-hydrolysing)